MNYSNEDLIILALEHVEASHEFSPNLDRNLKLQLIAQDLVSVYEDVVLISEKGIKFLIEKAPETLEMQELSEDSDYKSLLIDEDFDIEELEIDNG